MMDAFQSSPALIRSVRTLEQSVNTPLIITHDCCDLVPTPRQLELRFRTISCRAMVWEKGLAGKELRREGRKWRRRKWQEERRKEGKWEWEGVRFEFSFWSVNCFNAVQSSRWEQWDLNSGGNKTPEDAGVLWLPLKWTRTIGKEITKRLMEQQQMQEKKQHKVQVLYSWRDPQVSEGFTVWWL